MVYDNLIIGSGLTALATAYGLDDRSRVCVLAGAAQPELRHYDDFSRIPCENSGFGGLGAYWHGVIPTGQPSVFFDADKVLFEELFQRFYPESLESRYGEPWLFVPYHPIRPQKHWNKLCSERKHLSIICSKAHSIERSEGAWLVRAGCDSYRARRIWLAAGALATPALLERSSGFIGSSRTHVSDHVILYLGQLDRKIHQQILPPRVERKATGVWFLGAYDYTGAGLITTKPARFSYATLDRGIEQRSAFGLPTYGLIVKLCRSGSLGLISESLFNKLGLFPGAARLSAYAQVRVCNAYKINQDHPQLIANLEGIQKSIDEFRSALQWPELEKSKRPDLYIRGIHLHNSVDMKLLSQSGVLDDGSFTIVDASCITDIGPEHHSFKAMVRAYSLAKSDKG